MSAIVRPCRSLVAGLAVSAAALLFADCPSIAEDNNNVSPPPAGVQAQAQPAHSLSQNPGEQNKIDQITSASSLLEVPLVHIVPGGVKVGPKMKNPMANDPESADRGMKYFINFNCVGCHAPNGGGGMGISLSNSAFKFGSDPANLYLVISHGAPLGMPAWGALLPDNVIWDLVSYIESISKDSTKEWGVTVSQVAGLPKIEQVPAEFKHMSNPWQYTEPFSHGQKPTNHNPTAGPLPSTNSSSH